MPFAFAVSAKLKQMAFACAPASLTEKSQFFQPMTFGRIAFSAGVISMATYPFSRNSLNASLRLNVYSAAFAMAFLPKKGERSIHLKIHRQLVLLLVAGFEHVALVKGV